MGVPVKPRKQALGSARRMFAARLRYCVRWASSTRTKTLAASDRVGWSAARSARDRRALRPRPAAAGTGWPAVRSAGDCRALRPRSAAAASAGWSAARSAAWPAPPAPAISWNFWIVVITVLPVGCSRSRRKLRTLSARSGFGNPHAVNTPAICRSSFVRSVTMTTVGCRCAPSRRSLSASHSIVRLFPDPWVCQTIPPRAPGFRAVRIRRIASFTATNCL